MLSYRKDIWGIIFVLLFALNPIIIVNFGAAESNDLYLNKIAEIRFDVGYSVEIEDGIAYVCCNDGIIIIDIENPKKSKKIGEISLADGAFDCKIRNDTLYIAADELGLVIANVSNPRVPEIIGTLTRTGSAHRVEVKDNYCFLSYTEKETEIIDTTDLANPIFVKEMFDGSYFSDVLIDSDLLYCSNQVLGVFIVNITNPINSSIVKYLSVITGAHALTLKGNILYIGCHRYGIKGYNVSIPSLATYVASEEQDDEGEAIGLHYTGDYLCVADFYGVEIFNATKPSTLAKVAEYRQGISSVHDLKAVSNFVFAGTLRGLEVFEISSTMKVYFPPYLYYVLPIVVVVMGALSIFITRRRKMKVEN